MAVTKSKNVAFMGKRWI